MPTTRKSWIAIASILALLIVVATWFLLLSPVRAETGDLRTEAEFVEDNNEAQQIRVAKLRTQYAEIDTYRKELAELQKSIPDTVDYQSIVDEIERSVAESKVALISITSTEGITPVSPFTAIKEAKKETTSEDGEESEAAAPASTKIETVSGAAPTLTGALSGVVPGFYQIPLIVTVQGDYDEVMRFSDSLQLDSERALLVSSVAATALRETPESDGAPKAEVGDITYVLNVLGYVLEYDQSGIPVDADAELPESILPQAAKDNIFAPSR